jgi:hypothetical protein
MYRFFPVGQGLFTYGELGNTWDEPKVRWVYDCGTSSTQALLTDQLDGLFAATGEVTIDLLFISHFDKDHISGVAKLLGRFKVGYILLPYMSPEQLLIHAIQGGVEPGDPVFRFFTNPTDFLTGVEGVKGIGKVVYVQPSSGEGPELKDETPPEDDPVEPLFIPMDELPSDAQHLRPTEEGVTTEAKQLVQNGRVTAGPVWEFLMYNDDRPIDLVDLDTNAVNVQREILLGSKDESARESAMKEIKRLFHEKLRDGHKRNLISLFAYGGPVYQARRHGTMDVDVEWNDERMWHHCHLRHRNTTPRYTTPWMHGSILYTGDGYLDEPVRLDRMTRYFRGNRIARVNMLQVMHHGAKGNWHKGVAAALHPHFSVFSSDPAHRGYGHPHAPVVQDFEPYNVVQVDRENGFVVHYYVH